MLLQRVFISLFLILTALSFHPQAAHAKMFSNSYVSFELPPNWDCKLDGTDWVCTNLYAKQAKEAIIILTAKEVGPTDSIPAYIEHLKIPKNLNDKDGNIVPSKVLHVKERQIASHPWVDSMHLGSEITSYYTRYLATVKDRLAILVTFSAHKDHFTKYSNDFLKAIESLRAIAAKNVLDTKQMAAGPGSNEQMGTPIGLPAMNISDLPPEPNHSGDMKMKLIALALLIAAIGFYLWRRKKK